MAIPKNHTRLRLETLEARLPLHAGHAYFQNTLLPTDVNIDGVTNIADILATVYEWNASQTTQARSGPFDVNADNLLDIQDLLHVISKFNSPAANVVANTTPVATPAETFAELDTNDDLSLSREEFTAAPPVTNGTQTPDEIFSRWDLNDNNALSLGEFVAGKLPHDIFARLDANVDHLLSLDEFLNVPLPPLVTETVTEVFTRFDTDDSGSLSLEELWDGIPKVGDTITLPLDTLPLDPAELIANLDLNLDFRLDYRELTGVLLPPNVAGTVESIFAQWDSNSDGVLGVDELIAAIPRIPAIPAIPQIPAIPAIPQIPAIPAIPPIPAIPQIPAIPPIPFLGTNGTVSTGVSNLVTNAISTVNSFLSNLGRR